jgi:hypothetical protein
MYDDPQPDDMIQGYDGNCITVADFNAMNKEEKERFWYGNINSRSTDSTD